MVKQKREEVKTAECTDLVVKLPEVVSEVKINGEWIAERDELIALSNAVVAIKDKGDFGLAGDYLKHITKTSNKLESLRKEIAEPFRNAAELIKKAADKARAPLEEAKMRLQCIMNEFAMAQARKAEEERKAIEEAQRKAIAEQATKAEEERKKAEAEAADDPLAGDLPEPEPFQPVIPTIAPTVEKAKADSVRVMETLVFTVTDFDAVPRAMCTPDERKIRGWMMQCKDSIIKTLKENPAEAAKLMPGVKFSIETKVSSR